MSKIQIFDLHPTDSELSINSISYLNELTEEELRLCGGFVWVPFAIKAGIWAAPFVVAGAAYAWGRWGRC